MSELQIFAKFPIYEKLLNAIPYTLPVVMILLTILAMPTWIWNREQRKVRIMKMKPSGNMLFGCLILFLILSSTCFIVFLG